MTDGIIQEVIKKIILDTPATWYHRSTFITLEQELIEKIKQVCACSDEIGCFCSRLIGDNQE